MSRETALVERYRPLGRVTAGNALLLRHQDALAFTDECERRGLVILGVDFFYEVADGSLMPTTASADWSDLSRSPDAVQKTAEKTRKLIGNDFPCGTTWAEFVLSEPGDVPLSYRSPRDRPAGD